MFQLCRKVIYWTLSHFIFFRVNSGPLNQLLWTVHCCLLHFLFTEEFQQTAAATDAKLFLKIPNNQCTPERQGAFVSQQAVTLKRVVLCRTLEVQHISLMECMESCGAPMSTTGTPRRAARMGPMVVPHGLSFRTITSCRTKRGQTF